MFIVYPQLPVLVLLPLTMPSTWEWRAVPVMLSGILLLLWLVLGGGIWLSNLLGTVWPASPRLTELVARTAERVGTQPHAVWEADLGFSNAFALPQTQSLLITRSLLEHMSDDAMIAILAHELAHLGEPRSVSLLRISAVFFILPLGAAALIIDAIDLVGLLLVLLTMYLGVLLILKLARRMEHEADRVGQAHEVSPGDYARALERLYQIELLPVVLAGQALTHPHLYDRLLAAGVEPSYPRPAPPSRWREGLGFLTSVLIFLGGATTLLVGLYMCPLLVYSPSEPVVLARIALTGGDAMSLSQLAKFRLQRDQHDQAIILYRAAAELDADSLSHDYNLIMLLASLDRCDEAAAALEQARQRPRHRPVREEWWRPAEDAVMQCRQRQPSQPDRD
jgi:Zn-dependent protease with chaperone function